MGPNKITELSLVVPMYNEEENVEPLLKEIDQALRSSFKNFEIIIIDDASTDQTVNKLLNLKKAIPELRVLRHEKNSGQSRAVITGIKQAQYAWVATLDGDGQNNPMDIPKLAQAVSDPRSNPSLSSWVLIAGHRAHRKDTRLKKISSKIANKIRGSLLKDQCPDTGCGLKLFPKALFMNLPQFKNMHRFLPALARREDALIINIKISHRERMRGVSKYGVMNRLFVGIVDLLGVMWLVRRPSRALCKELGKELGKELDLENKN